MSRTADDATTTVSASGARARAVLASARRRAPRLLLVAVVAAAIAGGGGCRRRPHVDGTVAVDTILETWKNEGFDVEAVQNLDPGPWSAGACSQGPVSGLDVLLCEYAADDALAKGEQQVRQTWNQEHVRTGVVTHTSRTLLAITDKNAVDPTGRTIVRLIKMFRDSK